MAAFKIAEVLLSSVYLDNENPRHEPIDNEQEIIATLLRKERVTALAHDIAKHGVSPLERVAVVPHPSAKGKYVVVEGNRRVCAMKLLKDPDKAPNPKARATFAALNAPPFRLPARVEVAVFCDHKAASHWMKVRHQGEQQGVGVRKWNANQKARFSAAVGEGGSPNALALQLLDYAEKACLITSADRAKIAITTLTRYLSNPVLRDAIGLASPRELAIHAPQDEFDRAAKAFLEDAAAEIDPLVHSRSTAKEREAYAAALRAQGLATKTRLREAVVPNSLSSKRRQRNNPSPDLRPRVVPADFRAHLKSTVLKRVFDELRKLDPEFSFAAAYLFRAFIEKLANDYARDHGLGHGAELHVVISRCQKHLINDAALLAEHGLAALQRITKPLRKMADEKESSFSPDSLGAWVHGNIIPTAGDIKRGWDTLQPSIRLMVDGLKK